MTPTRYRECLDTLGVSQRGLAPILRCSDRLPRAWATGREIIPSEVANWLEAWVAIRLEHPDPSPPENSSRRRSPTATADGGSRAASVPRDCRENLTAEKTTPIDDQLETTDACPDGSTHRNGGRQITAQDQSPSMTTRDISDVLKEISTKLEQFGRLIAELGAACVRANDDDKRVAHLIITGFVRPALASFLRNLNREVN
jgi:hypothetical protein